MNKKSGTSKDAADKLVKGIRRKTRKQYSAAAAIDEQWSHGSSGRLRLLGGLCGDGLLGLSSKTVTQDTLRFVSSRLTNSGQYTRERHRMPSFC